MWVRRVYAEHQPDLINSRWQYIKSQNKAGDVKTLCGLFMPREYKAMHPHHFELEEEPDIMLRCTRCMAKLLGLVKFTRKDLQDYVSRAR